MKKEVMLKKLQVEQEVDRFNFCLKTCENIISEFNEYLQQLNSAYADYEEAITSENGYREKLYGVEREKECLQQGLSPYQRAMLETYEKELEECEEDMHATREVSRAYCAGPCNVGFYHHDEPDYEKRNEAQAKKEEIKRRLRSVGISLTIKDYDELADWYYNLYSNAKGKRTKFESDVYFSRLKLRKKYTEALLAEAQQQLLTDELNTLKIKADFIGCDKALPEVVDLPKIDDELCAEVIKSYESNISMALFKVSSNNKAERFMELLRKAHEVKSVMPSYEIKIKKDFWEGFKYGVLEVSVGGRKIKSIDGITVFYEDTEDSKTGGIVVDKEFDKDGYLLARLKRANEKSYQTVAIDLLGGRYYLAENETQPELSKEAKALAGFVSGEIKLEDIDKELLMDSDFKKALKFYMQRMFLYSKGVLGATKGQLSTEDKKALSTISKDINNQIQEQ